MELKILGWHIYVGQDKKDCRKKQCRSHIAGRLKELRNGRYKKLKGCCEACGKHYEKHELQMHHILPYAVFPSLTTKKWNLLMLCKRCHYLIHHNIVWQMEQMQATAHQHNVNLQKEYRLSAVRRWQENHKTIN